MTAWFTYMVEMIEELVLYNTCLLISCQLPQCLAEGVLKKKIGFTLLQYRGRVDRYLGQSGSLPRPEWITTWGGVDHYLGQSGSLPGASGSLPGAQRIKSWRCESNIRF